MENILTLSQISTTWIYHFNKPENMERLKQYANNKDKSAENLVGYYKWFISVLKDTPAWGVSGVNDVVNKLTDMVRATLTKAKSGKSSAYAHAGYIISTVEFYKNKLAGSHPGCRWCKLNPVISDAELNQFLNNK